MKKIFQYVYIITQIKLIHILTKDIFIYLLFHKVLIIIGKRNWEQETKSRLISQCYNNLNSFPKNHQAEVHHKEVVQ